MPDSGPRVRRSVRGDTLRARDRDLIRDAVAAAGFLFGDDLPEHVVERFYSLTPAEVDRLARCIDARRSHRV